MMLIKLCGNTRLSVQSIPHKLDRKLALRPGNACGLKRPWNHQLSGKRNTSPKSCIRSVVLWIEWSNDQIHFRIREKVNQISSVRLNARPGHQNCAKPSAWTMESWTPSRAETCCRAAPKEVVSATFLHDSKSRYHWPPILGGYKSPPASPTGPTGPTGQLRRCILPVHSEDSGEEMRWHDQSSHQGQDVENLAQDLVRCVFSLGHVILPSQWSNHCIYNVI